MNQIYLTYSDEEILEMIGKFDDEEAFAELYDRYFNVLYNFTYSKIDNQFITQEIVQELFVEFWQKRKIRNIKLCRPYLFGMVRNLILMYYRKEFTRQKHYQNWGLEQHDVSDLVPDQMVLTNDLQQHYEMGINLLPPKCKEVFLLSRQGVTYKEIAMNLRISEKTVEQHVSKGITILKHYLKERLTYLIIFISYIYQTGSILD